MAVPVVLPLVIQVIWQAWHEVRHSAKYHRVWILEVYPAWEPQKAEVIAETSKYEAFAAVDAKASELVRLNEHPSR